MSDSGHSRNPRAAILRDVLRLTAPLDILYHVGNLIYRRSLRYTVFTAGIGLLGVGAKQLGLPGFPVRVAVLLPLIVGVASLVGGSALKIIPSLIASKLLTAAQAAGLNLMEDYRKTQVAEHLAVLWDRVFRAECRLRLSAGREAFAGCRRDRDETIDDALDRAGGMFVDRAREALATPLPQVRQMYAFGLDLRLFEDWRDGAYLDTSDRKLIEQFEGNPSLVAARKAAGLAGPAASLRLGPARAAHKLWLALITRTVAVQVAGGVRKLNRRFQTDIFNCQVLLWPGEEDQAWLDQFPGGRQAVLELRRRAICRVFGYDTRTADRMLDRMGYQSFTLATKLRMRYDPRYCTGELGCDVLSDLADEGRSRRDSQRAEGFVQRTRERMEKLDAFIETHRRDLLDPAGAEALRAVRIAFHVDAHRLRRHVLTCDGSAGAVREISALIDRAAADSAAYSRRLLSVRIHHELTRLARRGYRELVMTLAFE